jgi:threonyl-tRNA synthetase
MVVVGGSIPLAPTTLEPSMPIITLPDGTQRRFDNPVTVLEVAQNIGAGLAKAALAGRVDGELVDTSHTISQDAALAIITEKSDEALDIIRHSCAHVLAQAVQRLFPDAQVTIGPVIEDGFYYDFSYSKGFTPDDLTRIEAEMQKIVQEDLPVARSVMGRDEAIDFFLKKGELYKAEIIKAIPEGETLSLYQQGEFIDLCRGPHIPRTGVLKAFKLTKQSGAYWRGDANNEMLQRIYGTAWANPKDLAAYMHRLEEAGKRDHRKIAKAQDLFHIQEEAPGMVFWHDKGYTIYRTIEQYMRTKLRAYGYQEIRTPQIVDKVLWEKSGHWDNFRHEMFVTESEGRVFAVKPMNCPCHIQVFNQGLKSYRDLPLRLAEFGSCHRNELSGALHGLMRVRNFTQDDAHIFCTEDQIASETQNFIKMLKEVYADFGFNEVLIRLSTRPEQRVGSDALWDKAEAKLQEVLDDSGLPWTLNPGDGAFYGPKIDFTLKDCLGRTWQCGTVQLDFALPGRLGANYIAEDGSKQVPVMIHRAILGSFERFIGVLIEHYAGQFPTWLAPVQAVVLNITDAQSDYAKNIAEKLQKEGLRVNLDLRNEKIGFKIREHTLARVPYLIVVGDKEVDTQTLAIRTLKGEDLGAMSLEAFSERLKQDLAHFGRTV